MYPQSVASNAARERQALIRHQAAEIEALKIENAKLRREVDLHGDFLKGLYGKHGQDVDDAINAWMQQSEA